MTTVSDNFKVNTAFGTCLTEIEYDRRKKAVNFLVTIGQTPRISST